MPRYRATDPRQIKVGDRIRLTRRLNDPYISAEAVFTGPVAAVHFDGLRVGAFELPGEVIAHVRKINGWDCISVELELPDLPRNPGSVIKVGNRYAIWTRIVPNFPSDNDWAWLYTDSLSEQVTDADLERAEIVGA